MDTLHPEVHLGKDAVLGGLAVELQNKDLFFVEIAPAFPRDRFDNGGTSGREPKALLAQDLRSIQGG